MINDYLEIRNAEGMPKLVDGAIALSFLLSAKSAVRNCAVALTESVTPEVRTFLQSQLETAINLHEEISLLMVKKGWFHPQDLSEQYRIDMESSNMVLQVAGLDLFPGDTSRLGTFATPEK